MMGGLKYNVEGPPTQKWLHGVFEIGMTKEGVINHRFFRPFFTMHRYLIIDGMLNGTGIRDYYEGGYVKPTELNLSSELLTILENWLSRYWEAFYMNYKDSAVVENLDAEGARIAQLVQKELGGKVWYYSDATQQKIEL